MNNASASEILRQIVAIPSVNPALAENDSIRGEARMVAFLEPWFAAKGFRAQRVGATPGRPNLLARFGATAPKKTKRASATAPDGMARRKSLIRRKVPPSGGRHSAPTHTKAGQGLCPWPATFRWSRRESNPGPTAFPQGFSVRSPLCLYLDLLLTRTSQDDDPSHCLMSR